MSWRGYLPKSNSKLPAWQSEDGMPRILRLDPTFQAADAEQASAQPDARFAIASETRRSSQGANRFK